MPDRKDQRKQRDMKKKRQEKLLSLIREQNIDTQDSLCEALKAAGFDVTQATVSRDIRELKISKVTSESGEQYYVAGEQNRRKDDGTIRTIFKEAVVSIDDAGNILVVKTLSGMAMAVAAAIDAMNIPEIVGSIAGDDTIMCAIKTTDETTILKKKLLEIIE